MSRSSRGRQKVGKDSDLSFVTRAEGDRSTFEEEGLTLRMTLTFLEGRKERIGRQVCW